MSSTTGEIGSGLALFRAGLPIGPRPQQHLRHAAIAVGGGGMQPRPAALLTGIRIATVLENQGQAIGIVPGDSGMHRRHPHRIERGLIHIGPVLQ